MDKIFFFFLVFGAALQADEVSRQRYLELMKQYPPGKLQEDF